MDKSPITVLHIASGDLWAGAEVQLFTLAKALENNTNTKVHIILLNHGRLEKELLSCGIDVIVLDESTLNGFQILRKVIHVIKRIRPDVIHSHRSKENILASVAALLTGNIPTLRTAHGAPEHKPAWHNIAKRIVRYLDWFCGRWIQKKIIAVSTDLAGILKKNFPADKIKVIENGIDTSSYIDLVKSDDSNTRPSNTPLKIGIAGRLVPVKRVDIFIKAANKLSSDHPELKLSFHIFGDGPLRTELVTLNQKLNARGKIHFEGHCENMQHELANLDILLITSDHEGLPMILLEAMALKTPVVAHAVGGIPKVLDQGKCGALVSEQKASNYANAIFQLLSSEEYRSRLIKNSFKQVTEHYSSENNAMDYHAVYSGLVYTNNPRQ